MTTKTKTHKQKQQQQTNTKNNQPAYQPTNQTNKQKQKQTKTHGWTFLCLLLVLELVGPTKRTMAGSLLTLLWLAGPFTLAALSYLVRDWQYLQLISSLPLVLCLGHWWWELTLWCCSVAACLYTDSVVLLSGCMPTDSMVLLNGCMPNKRFSGV